MIGLYPSPPDKTHFFNIHNIMCSSFVLSAGTTGSQQNTGILYCNNHDNLAIVKPVSLCMKINSGLHFSHWCATETYRNKHEQTRKCTPLLLLETRFNIRGGGVRTLPQCFIWSFLTPCGLSWALRCSS